MICQKELGQVLADEGFKSYPYLDTVGVTTIGHGLTFLTLEESAYIVEFFRLPAVERDLVKRHPWIASSPPEVQMILINMAYQLGITGLSNFKNMLGSINDQDYRAAATHGRDSKWYRQTTSRAERLMSRLEQS